jgi:hypothetical protein
MRSDLHPTVTIVESPGPEAALPLAQWRGILWPPSSSPPSHVPQAAGEYRRQFDDLLARWRRIEASPEGTRRSAREFFIDPAHIDPRPRP